MILRASRKVRVSQAIAWLLMQEMGSDYRPDVTVAEVIAKLRQRLS